MDALSVVRVIIKRSRCPSLGNFARMVLISQREEIFERRVLLEKRGLPPLRVEPSL